MAAGLGFKDFVTGEVLTAADVDGYLMQGVWVFADATARDAAVTSPQEGNFAYLKDTNVTTYYTGSAWANLDTTGMTNPMTTTGDTIYSSSGSTPARLGIGSTGQVLTVSGGLPVWSTPAGGGGKVLQVVSATYDTPATTTSTSYSDTGLTLSITPTLATSKVLVIISQAMDCNPQVNTTAVAMGLKLQRNSSDILDLSGGAAETFGVFGPSGPLNNLGFIPITYLDSPATTSSVTYKTVQRAKNSDTQARAQHNNVDSTITLLEIGV